MIDMNQQEKIIDPQGIERSVIDYVRGVKAAWREEAQKKTWEEKVAAIERMWERDRALRATREANRLAQRARVMPEEGH
jgi:hypothetical protein